MNEDTMSDRLIKELVKRGQLTPKRIYRRKATVYGANEELILQPIYALIGYSFWNAVTGENFNIEATKSQGCRTKEDSDA